MLLLSHADWNQDLQTSINTFTIVEGANEELRQVMEQGSMLTKSVKEGKLMVQKYGMVGDEQHLFVAMKEAGENTEVIYVCTMLGLNIVLCAVMHCGRTCCVNSSTVLC